MIQWSQARPGQARHRTPSGFSSVLAAVWLRQSPVSASQKTTGKMSTNVPHNVGTINSGIITAQSTVPHTQDTRQNYRVSLITVRHSGIWLDIRISLTKIRPADVTTPSLFFVTFHESPSFSPQFSYMKLLLTNYANALNLIPDWVSELHNLLLVLLLPPLSMILVLHSFTQL